MSVDRSDHPTLADLAHDPPAPEVQAHLATCEACQDRRRQLLAATRDETWIPEGRASAGPSGVAWVTNVPSSVRDRLAALDALPPVAMLRWLTAEPDGETLRVVGEEPAPRRIAHLDPASQFRAVTDAVLAVVTLHREGLAHGNLDPDHVSVTEAGRVRLPWPALTNVPGRSDDGPALAALLATWPLPSDRLSPLLDALRDGDDTDALAATLTLQTSLAFGDTRYRPTRKLGEGGMGVVYEVEDDLLHRRLALKRLKPAVRDASRFVAEAQLTSQLQHPGIVPVHALGEDDEGRPFYTMEIVDGQTLAEVLEQPSRFTLARLVDILARVCDAVAYAHERGVVHRDLKPANIMVGRHGEVRVMDWGIAEVLDTAAPSLRTVRTEGDPGPSRISGTPRYLAPEVGPDHLGDQRRDVYALGCILRDLWGDDPPPVSLADLAAVCTARKPDARPDDAGAVGEALRDWLEGLARRRLAEASVSGAVPLMEAATRAREGATVLRGDASQALDGVATWSPLTDKEDAWAMEDRAAELEVEARVLETRYEQGLRAALDHDPDLPEARTRIAELYRTQLLRAEASDAVAEVARLRTLLETHDGGRHRAWLDEGGRISLETEPSGARVFLDRYVEVARRLVPEPVEELGTTPLVEVPLARGSWRLRIEHPDAEPVVVPIMIGRGEHLRQVPPGEGAPEPVVLPPRGSLGPDDCYVPAGWFVSGGDAEAGDGLPRRRLWVDAFVIRRFPVTVAEYTTFLTAVLDGNGDPSPYVPAAPSSMGERPLLEPRDGRWVRTTDAVGPRALEPNWPVTSISWHAAHAYAVWRAERDGLPWRLPHDQEWEKAARGADARLFPWGHHFDGRFACTLGSQQGPPTIQPIDTFALDESPYGVRGLAGNVRDWCGNGYLREGPPAERVDTEPATKSPYRTMRGGSASSQPMAARCATRLVERPTSRILAVGFRLARSAPTRQVDRVQRAPGEGHERRRR
ncbi:MAG: SUMF1/EgtB/PvdO family nonheme iron enzyme [Myxococcota bacterium]